MLPISTKKKKAKLSDSDPDDCGIQTIYDKYSGEKHEMFSEEEVQQIIKMHQELAKCEKTEELNNTWLHSREHRDLDYADPLKDLNEKLASFSK